MKKNFITALSLATLLGATLFSATFAQTSQVSYYNEESVPLFQGTLAYQDGFSFESLTGYIIGSDEAFYSAQYYGERADSPESMKLAVLDGFVVWQFDFIDQVICIDAQNATNAYALPVDGVAYTYIIDDFSYNNAVYSNTAEAASYVDSGNSGVVVYDQNAQENYNISNDGYVDLYGGYATYEEYLAAYTAMQVATPAVEAPVVSSYSEVIYLGSANTPVASTISIQPVVQTPAVVGPVHNLGLIAVANTVGSDYGKDFDSEGYDSEGYDFDGYDRDGYDREGYDRPGYDTPGYDREGYDREGYNRTGYDREGYNREGLNSAGKYR